tara:strand:- start:323 stop:538 length:216 start_codon:yes stop_codon:yes gene_type:complete
MNFSEMGFEEADVILTLIGTLGLCMDTLNGIALDSAFAQDRAWTTVSEVDGLLKEHIKKTRLCKKKWKKKK